MVRARKKILEMGGVTEVNTFTKIYLCFLGQYDYDAVPAIPPEIVLFPKWFWFNIYEISSWSRAILVPLSICLREEAVQEDSRMKWAWKSCSLAGATSRACTCLEREAGFLAQLLSGSRPDDALVRAGAHSSAALAGAEAGGEVDAGTLRDERRLGRDLSRR